MRMWMLNPKLLCKNHLLGCHNELHKHRHNFVKKHRIDKRIYPVVQIEPANMESRHNEIVKEMLRHGYNHNSEYKQPDISYLPKDQQNAKVNLSQNKIDLMNRCPDCYLNILRNLMLGNKE